MNGGAHGERVVTEDGRDNELVLRIIRHAAVAGACRVVARREPEAARGLLRAAAFHSARTEFLAGEICARTVEGPAGAQP